MTSNLQPFTLIVPRQILLVTGLSQAEAHSIEQTVVSLFGQDFLGAWTLPEGKIAVIFPNPSKASAARWLLVKKSSEKTAVEMGQEDVNAALGYLCAVEFGTSSTVADQTNLWLDMIFAFQNQKRQRLRPACETSATAIYLDMLKNVPDGVDSFHMRSTVSTLKNHDTLAKLHPVLRAAENAKVHMLESQKDLAKKLGSHQAHKNMIRGDFLDSERDEVERVRVEALAELDKKNLIVSAMEARKVVRQAEIQARMDAAAARQLDRDNARGGRPNPSVVSEADVAHLIDRQAMLMKSGAVPDL